MTAVDPFGQLPQRGQVPTGNGPKPIGVPANYTTPHTPRGSFGHPTGPTVKVPPAYHQGDEYGAVPGFPTSPGDIAKLQSYLVQAGLLDDKKVIYGQWDKTSAAAFASILGSANVSGDNWQNTLGQRMKLADQQHLLERQSATKQQRAPLQTQVTNPADLHAAVDQASQAVYAGKLSPAELNQFISDHQAREISAQTDAYNTETTGGNVTAAPSVQTDAENAVKQAHPDQIFVSSLGKLLGDAFGGTQGQVSPASPYTSQIGGI